MKLHTCKTCGEEIIPEDVFGIAERQPDGSWIAKAYYHIKCYFGLR